MSGVTELVVRKEELLKRPVTRTQITGRRLLVKVEAVSRLTTYYLKLSWLLARRSNVSLEFGGAGGHFGFLLGQLVGG